MPYMTIMVPHILYGIGLLWSPLTLYGTGIVWSLHMYIWSPHMYDMIFFRPALTESTACPYYEIIQKQSLKDSQTILKCS